MKERMPTFRKYSLLQVGFNEYILPVREGGRK